MSFTKIIKQDIITGLKKNLNENNIEELISEVKQKTEVNFNVKLIEKGYKLFESFITYSLESKNKEKNVFKESKISGYGRTKYEALSNSFINMIESLLEVEKYFEPIKDSLKTLSSNIKEPNPLINTSKIKANEIEKDDNQRFKRTKNSNNLHRPTEIITNDNEESETKALVSMLTNDKQLILCHEEVFSYYGYYQSIFDSDEFISFKNEYHEKTLIINELEKMVLDMMNQLKKITEVYESEVENYPDYFKCPISWEKLENPVVSMEGHSYEKWAIDKWLINQETSPITGLVLEDNTLISNYALKSAIDDFNKKILKWKKLKQELLKYITKSEYDLNDLKKYFGCKI